MTRFLFSHPNTNDNTSLYAYNTSNNTVTNLDISQFSSGSFLDRGEEFTQFDGKTDFIGDTPRNSFENYSVVYHTVGTAAGTDLSFVVGSGPAYPQGLWVLGNQLLTSGDSQEGATELWASSDGVTFNAIETSVYTSDIVVSHGLGFFDGLDKNYNNTGLWRTNGTTAGTYRIAVKGATLNPTDIASVAGGKTVFVNQNANGTDALWITDGTAKGTHQVVDAALGNNIDPGRDNDIGTADGHAIFSAIGADKNISVWSSDGTAKGTSEILVNGPINQPIRTPGGYEPWGNKVLFTSGYNTFVTDGTAAGTIRIGNRSSDFYAPLGNRVFIATPGSDDKPDLYTSDGKTKDTLPLPLHINGLRAANANYETGNFGDFTVVDGKVVFAGIDTFGKEAFFISDGTTRGSHELPLPAGVTIDPNNLPIIGPLSDLPPLATTLPDGLTVGIHTVTGTGGIAGLQLESVSKGSHNKPGGPGWVKAKVAADGSWSAQLRFVGPDVLNHVYAQNGRTSTVLDLMDTTTFIINATAAVSKSVATEMTKGASVHGRATALVSPVSSVSAGSMVSAPITHAAAMAVSDHLKVASHAT